MARIRHLAILMENVDKLVEFYTHAFGLKTFMASVPQPIFPMGTLTSRSYPSSPSAKLRARS